MRTHSTHTANALLCVFVRATWFNESERLKARVRFGVTEKPFGALLERVAAHRIGAAVLLLEKSAVPIRRTFQFPACAWRARFPGGLVVCLASETC